MNTRQVVMAVMGTVLKVVMAALVIAVVYKGAVIAYDYGYRIFNEEPMAQSPGTDVTVEVTMGKTALQIGEILQSEGLVRDAKLFYIQNLLSHYKDQMKPGVYVLNTSMTMQEMMEVMSPQTTETDETETDQTESSAEGESTKDAGSGD